MEEDLSVVQLLHLRAILITLYTYGDRRRTCKRIIHVLQLWAIGPFGRDSIGRTN